MAAQHAKGRGKGGKAKAQPNKNRQRAAAPPTKRKAGAKAAPSRVGLKHPAKKAHAPPPKKTPSAQPAAGDKTPLRDDAVIRPAGQKFSIGKDSILSLGELSKPLDKDETLSSLQKNAPQKRQPKVLLSREEAPPEHEMEHAEEQSESPEETPQGVLKKERPKPAPTRKKERRKERRAAPTKETAAQPQEELRQLTEEQFSVLEKAPLPKGLAQPELKRKPLPPPPPPPWAGLAPATKPPEPLPGLPTGKTEDAFEDMKRAVLKVPQAAQKTEVPEAPSPEEEMPSPPSAEEPEKQEENLPVLPPTQSAEELIENAVGEEKPARGSLFSFFRKRKKEVPEESQEEEEEPQRKLPLPPELPVEEFIEETIIKAVSEPLALLGEPEEAFTITHDYPYLPIEEEERPHTVVQEEAPPAPEQGPSPKGEMPSPLPPERPKKPEEGLPRLPPEQPAEELVESTTVEGKPADGGLFSFLRKQKKRAPQKLPVAGERPEGVLPLPPEPPAGKEEEAPVAAVQERMPPIPEPEFSLEEEEELPPPPLASEEQQQLPEVPEDLGLVKEAETAPTGEETSTEPGFQHTLVFPQSEIPALLLPDETKPDRLERIELLWEEADQLWKGLRSIPDEDVAFRKDLENGIDVVERRHRIIMPESEEELEIPDDQEIVILNEAQKERERALEERKKEPLRKQAPEERKEELPVHALLKWGKWKTVPQEQHLSEIAESVKKAVGGKVAEPEEELPEPPHPNEDEEPIGGFFGEEPPGVIPQEEEELPQPQLPPALLEVPETTLQKKRVKETLPEKAAEAAAPAEETLPKAPAPEEEAAEEPLTEEEKEQLPGEEAEEQPFPADILDITDEMLSSHDKRPLRKAAKSTREFGSFIRKEGLTAEELKGIRAKAGKKHTAGKKLSLAQRRKAAKRERKAASLLAARRRDILETRFKLSESKVESILKESGELDVSLKPQTTSAGRLPPLVEEAPLEPAEKERKREARRENADSFEKERLVRAILSESEEGIAPAGQKGGFSRKDVEREEKRLQERMAEEERGKRVEEILNQLSILASTMRASLGQKDYAAADQVYQRIRQLKHELGGKDLGKLGYELVMLETDLKLARLG